jgi:hypothetical protein
VKRSPSEISNDLDFSTEIQPATKKASSKFQKMVLKGKIFAAPFLKALKEEFFPKESKKKTIKKNSLSIKIAVTVDK